MSERKNLVTNIAELVSETMNTEIRFTEETDDDYWWVKIGTADGTIDFDVDSMSITHNRGYISGEQNNTLKGIAKSHDLEFITEEPEKKISQKMRI